MVRRRWCAFAAIMLVALALTSCGAGARSRGVMAKDDEDRLLAAIPVDIRGHCVAESLGNVWEGEGSTTAVAGHPGAIAGFFCRWEPASGGPGSVSLSYLLFPDRSTMYEDYWTHWGVSTGLGGDCRGKKSSESLILKDGERAGRVFCAGGAFQPEITWTDDDVLVLSHALQIPFADVGAAELYAWWVDRQPGEIVLRVPAPRA